MKVYNVLKKIRNRRERARKENGGKMHNSGSGDHKVRMSTAFCEEQKDDTFLDTVVAFQRLDIVSKHLYKGVRNSEYSTLEGVAWWLVLV
jgi:hypothetical protein